MSPLEGTLLVLFILYIALPVSSPSYLAGSIDSPVTMAIMFAITIFLFVYTNPILGVLYIFVAYELLRRSSFGASSVAMVQFTPSQRRKDVEMTKMNPPKVDLLEVEMVAKMAPLGHSEREPLTYVSSKFKPVAEDVGNASFV